MGDYKTNQQLGQPVAVLFFSQTKAGFSGEQERGPLVQIGVKWQLSDHSLGNYFEWHLNLRDIYNGTIFEVENNPEAIARIKRAHCPTQAADKFKYDEINGPF